METMTVWHCPRCERELALSEWNCPRCDAPPRPQRRPQRRLRPRQALRAVMVGLIFTGLFIAVVGSYWSGFGWFSVIIALLLVLGWTAR